MVHKHSENWKLKISYCNKKLSFRSQIDIIWTDYFKKLPLSGSPWLSFLKMLEGWLLSDKITPARRVHVHVIQFPTIRCHNVSQCFVCIASNDCIVWSFAMLMFALPDTLQATQLCLNFMENKPHITLILLPPAVKVLWPHNPRFLTALEAVWGPCLPRQHRASPLPPRVQKPSPPGRAWYCCCS